VKQSRQAFSWGGPPGPRRTPTSACHRTLPSHDSQGSGCGPAKHHIPSATNTALLFHDVPGGFPHILVLPLAGCTSQIVKPLARRNRYCPVFRPASRNFGYAQFHHLARTLINLSLLCRAPARAPEHTERKPSHREARRSGWATCAKLRKNAENLRRV
jgi:hypothetical protein